MAVVDALKGKEEQRRDKADAAVRAFRQLQPTLSSYARMLSGRQDVRVEVAAKSNGSTDGTRIFFRPPIELGDRTPHEPRLCDRRDKTGRMLCPACKIREAVLVTIYHEIAHICHDSFAKTNDADRRRAINFAIRETNTRYAHKASERINNAPHHITDSYMGLAQLINEHLPFLVNCLEDARVNEALFRVRPGVRLMFYVDTKEIFDNGYECVDQYGTPYVQEWNKAPLNSQVMIGCFCKASGYKYTGWFHPRVEAALDDPELTNLINTMNASSSAGSVFALSFKVLARLRELGFCGTPQDPDPQPAEPTEDSTDAHSDDESSDVPSQNEDAESSDRGEGTDESDEESSPLDSVERDDEGEEGRADSGAEGSSEESGTRPANDDSDSSEDANSQEAGVGDESAEETDSEGQQTGEHSDPESSNEAGKDSSGGEQGHVSGDSGTAEGEDADPDGHATGSSGDDSSESHMAQDGDVEFPESDGDGLSDGGFGDGSDSRGEGELASLDGDDQSPEAEGTDGSRGDPLEGTSEDQATPGDAGAGGPDDEEVIDTGADDGYGGTRVIGDDEPPMGDPSDIDPIIKLWGQHEEKPATIEMLKDEEAVETAIIQGLYFTKPSTEVRGVVEHHYDVPESQLGRAWARNPKPTKFGQKADMEVPESVLQPAVLHLRRAFTDNQIAAMQGNLKSGRVNRRMLGRRAWNDDDRLFNKRKLPGRQDWFVVIGMDVSGSTSGVNLAIEKRVVYAQAEMLNRVGIPFALYAHTGSHRRDSRQMDLEMYHIKDASEPWNAKTQERLERIGPSAANLDGHALEYLRKRADESNATDKIILYYSDGKMPLENFDEELGILQYEIAQCKRKQYTLLGVGIRTDSPRAHGLDTVQVNGNDDLLAVVKHLAKRIAGDF